jgi:WD40 repeat protein
VRITCSCGKSLRVNDDLVGKRVKCPACGERLLVEEDLPAVPAERSDEATDKPRPRRKKSQKAKTPSNAVWLAVGGGGLLVVLAVGVLVLVLVLNRSSPPTGDLVASPGQPPTANQPPATGLRAEKSVNRLAYSPDGKYLAIAIPTPPKNVGNTVKVWNLATGQELAKFEAQENVISGLVFSPNGELLATSGVGEMKAWDWRARTLRHEWAGEKGQPQLGTRLLQFSPDNKTLVSITKGYVVMMDVETGKVDRDVIFINGTAMAAGIPGKPLIAIVQILESSPPKGALTLYDYGSKSEGQTVDLTVLPTSMCFSRDGSTLGVADSSGPVRLLETMTWKVRATLQRERAKDNSFMYFEHIGLSPDGTVLCGIPMGSGRKNAEMWSASAKETQPIAVGWAADVAFAPDGKTVAVATREEGVKFADPLTGQEKLP